MTDAANFPPDTGILIVGHGTRDARGQAEFLQAADMLRARLSHVAVAACFLELAAPDIATGVEKLAAAGVRHFIAAPLLLFSAGHAKRDIPEAIARAVQKNGKMSWQMAAPLEDHAAVLELSARRFREVSGSSETTLIFVGRGSSDPAAVASVHQFAQQRRQLTPVAAQQVCFLAAATPTFDDAIDWAISQPAHQIVVQPHLLFHGQLIQEINTRIAAVAEESRSVEITWHIAEHLGAAEAVVDALHDRICEAASGE